MQLMAQQLAAVQVNLAKLVTEQVILAMNTLRTRESQTPLVQGNYVRRDQDNSRDTVISSVEILTDQGTRSQDGPIRGTDAQELNDRVDPTFEAWGLQVLARFRDDPSWYNSEERKLDYILRRTKGDAQVYILAGMKDKRLPGFFETAQDVLTALRQALVNP